MVDGWGLLLSVPAGWERESAGQRVEQTLPNPAAWQAQLAAEGLRVEQVQPELANPAAWRAQLGGRGALGSGQTDRSRLQLRRTFIEFGNAGSVSLELARRRVVVLLPGKGNATPLFSDCWAQNGPKGLPRS